LVLKIDYDTEKLQKVTYDVIKITSLKSRHQNDVTKIFHFQLSSIRVALLHSIVYWLVRIKMKLH